MKVWKKGLVALLTAAMTFTPAFSSVGAFAPVTAYAANEADHTEFSATVEKTTIAVDEEIQITVAKAEDYEETVTYSSNATDVATVTDGTIKGIAYGDAVITVTAPEETGKYKVATETINIHVDRKDATLSIEGDASSAVAGGATVSLTANTESDGTKTWTSSDTDIATVASNGEVTFLKAGVVTITAAVAQTNKYNAISATKQITIGKGEQTLGGSPITSANVGETEDLGVEVTKGNKSDGALTYKSSDTSIATVDKDGNVTALKKGSVTITVTAAANDDYNEKSGEYTITIGKGTQVIEATSPVSKKVGESFNVGATLKKGNGTLSYKSDKEEKVSVDYDTGLVTIKGYPTSGTEGEATITVTASETADWEPISKTVKVNVTKADTVIDVTKTVNLKVGEKFKLDAEVATGDGTLKYNAPANNSVATYSNGEIEAKGVGTTTMIVQTTGSTDYTEGSETVTINVAKGVQEITVTSGTTVTKNKGDETFMLGAAKKYTDAESTIVYASSNESVATVENDGTVNLLNAGTTDITISTEATTNFEAATTTVKLTVTASENHTITITAEDVEKTYGEVPFALGATADPAEAAVTYELKDESVLKYDSESKEFTIVGVGTATITVKAAGGIYGGDEYDAAKKDVTVTVKKADQTVTAKGAEKEYGDAPFSLGAKTTGDGVLSYKSSNEKVATVNSKGTVTVVGVGTAKITVQAAASDNYNESEPVEATITVEEAQDKITVDSKIERTTADSAFSLGAKTESGAALTYSSSDKSIVDVDDNGTVTIKGDGTATITIKAAKADNYKQATDKGVTVIISASAKKTQTITAEDQSAVYEKDGKVQIKASTDGDGALTYEAADSDTIKVDKNTGVAEIVKPGTVEVTISAAEGKTYNAAENKTINYTVNPADREIVLDAKYSAKGSVGYLTKTAGNTFKLDGITDSAYEKGEFDYESSTNKVTVDTDGNVTIADDFGDGAAFITVKTKAKNNVYYKEATAFIFLTINNEPQAQTITANDKTVSIGTTEALGATTNAADDGATLVYESDTESVAEVDEKGNIVAKTPGTAKITITSAATDNFTEAEKKVVTITVVKGTQVITASNKTKTYGNAAFALGAKLTAGDGTLSYKSSNTKVAKVSNAGKITIKGAGTAKITVTAAGTDNYEAATKTVTVKVNKAKNPMTVAVKAQTASSTKKTTLTAKKVFTVRKNQGKVTYAKKSGDKNITVAKNGKITVKKGLKKGTYKVVVNVTAAGNSNYNKLTKAVTVKITVK